MKPGDVVSLGAKQKVKLVDLYADSNKVFRSHGIGRYELEVLEA